MKKIIIAGGSGFIGKELAKFLARQGHEVSILSRNPIQNTEFRQDFWNPDENEIDVNVLADKDIIINLSGAGIADKRWSNKRKKLILSSRIRSTQLLVDTIRENNYRPSLFVNSSAIGFYGNRQGEKLTEKSYRGKGFLSDACQSWEYETRYLSELNIPLTILRLGIVLSEKGGSLPLIAKPMRFGINVVFNHGNHYISWIHINDLMKIFSEIIDDRLEPGIYNAVGPFPVSQKNMNTEISRALNKMTLKINLPMKISRLLIGEMITLLTDDQYVVPEHLKKQDFGFEFPEIESALKDLIGQ